MGTLEMRLARCFLGPDHAPPPCDHAPVACVSDPDNVADCLVNQLKTRWRKEPRPFPQTEHPLVFALWRAGYDRYKARPLASDPGYGMTHAPELVRALRKIKMDERLNPVPTPTTNHQENKYISVGGIRTCIQCRPGTNTWSYCAPYNIRQSYCRRVPINLINLHNQRHNGNDHSGVLCLGRNGATKTCAENEFMAVSHVWSHGWQGCTEDGICSRVLDMLLEIASTKFGVDWIWLDIAMVSNDKALRAMAINSMDRVYATAKATLVVDRLLLNFHPAAGKQDDKQTALAITASDWMTRLWTMQEAMLSRTLFILTSRDGQQPQPLLDPRQLLNRIILAKHDPDRWKQYVAIEILSSMTHDPKPSLRKVVAFSYERATTHPIDLVRALYPLFGLKWPSHETTLVQGQILLLKRLGQEAAILTSLDSPIGLPSPWRWAPLVIPGASGGALAGCGRRVSEQEGLIGAWGWLEVKPVAVKARDAERGRLATDKGWMNMFTSSFATSRQYRSSQSSSHTGQAPPAGGGFINYALGLGADILKSGLVTAEAERSGGASPQLAKLSEMVGLKHVYAIFRSSSSSSSSSTSTAANEFTTLLTYTARDPWPWPNQRLFFIASADLTLQVRDSVLKVHQTPTYMDLVVVESEQDGWFIMRRVGKIVAMGVKLKGENEAIQGVLH